MNARLDPDPARAASSPEAARRQARRLLRLTFPRHDAPAGATLLAQRLEASEGLSRDFEFRVDVLADRADVAPDALLGRMACVSLVRDDGSLRHFNGHVFDWRFVRNDAGFARYAMVLAPWMAFLRHRHNHRIFHGRTVEEQTRLILADHPASDWQVHQLAGDRPLTDAFQIDESDHNYLHRRWEALGWHYRYEHRADGHTLVLGGESTACPALDGEEADVLWRGAGDGIRQAGLWRFAPGGSVQPTRCAATAFDFKAPAPVTVEVPTLGRPAGVPTLEAHDYAGAHGFRDRRDGEAQVRRRMEALEAAGAWFEAEGDDDRLQPGRWFRLVGHRDATGSAPADGGDEHLVREVEHVAVADHPDGRGEPAGYRSRIVCGPRRVPWRPARGFHSVEPKVYGVQSAVVVGPEGEEVPTDEHGRVRVQFHWDREGTLDERSSAFLRVASGWAGQGFGQTLLPRAGDEVLVQWLGGHPDRPIVTGRVHNAGRMPARFSGQGSLPGNRYLGGLRSKEVKGHRGNQLRLDDTPGQISAQLASDHRHSELNLGHLTQPRQDGHGAPRGEGFELRSDGSGALRTARSLLVSAWKRLEAAGDQLDAAEHLALMQDCLDLFKSLGGYAAQHHGLAADAAGQSALKDDVKAAAAGSNADPQGRGGAPTLSLTAPDGIAMSTAKTLSAYAAVNLDATAQQHVQLAAGQRVVVNAGQGVGLFAHAGGLKAIAHQGPLTLQSQHDETRVDAAKNIQIRAAENVFITGRTLSFVAEDGSFIKVGSGGITLGSNGPIAQKAASFTHSGPATLGSEVPTFDKGKPDGQFVLRFDRTDPQSVAAHQRYRIDLSDGSVIEGVSDAQGLTVLTARQAMHIASIEILSGS